MSTKPHPNGIVDESSGSGARVKKLYGVPNERGGSTWLDECPDYLKTDSKVPDHALVARYKEAKAGLTKRLLNLDSVEIHSPYLQQLLRQVFRTYPGEEVDQDDLELEAPFQQVFHRWATLQAVRENAQGQDKEELTDLLDILDEQLGADMQDARSLSKNGNITFRLLWSLFPPGAPVFGIWKGQRHLFLVNSARYLKAELVPMLVVELLALDHDGDRYGWTMVNKYISSFDGSTRIEGLDVVPLHFFKDADTQLEKLYARAVRTADLLQTQPQYCSHSGGIRLHTIFDGDEIEVYVEGRTIIDAKSHSLYANRFCPSVSSIPHKLECLLTRDVDTKSFTEGQSSLGLLSVLDNLNNHPVLSQGPCRPGLVPLSNDANRSLLRRHIWTEALFGIRPETFCRSALRGYDLTTKAWAEFEVHNLSDIVWNHNAFDALVIPPARKRILESLVKQQQSHKADADIDDVIAGKGRGLICLLSGPPGTGKTLTAESIADRLHLPLYSVSANELGDDAKEIELQFGRVLKLAGNWNAVLLLDEADAFLEKRLSTPSAEARDRNKRVAAFLRILEYYEGILLLTTNRTVKHFDDAFYSRIHLNLPFKALDQESRVNIWGNFLRGAQISKEDVSRFASEELNGRQIKNVMKMARLLARDGGEEVQARHVDDVLDVIRQDAEPDEVQPDA